MKRFAAVVLALFLGLATSARADETPRAFEVPAGDLAQALDQLARQGGLELIYRSDEFAGWRSVGVSGLFTPQEALARLLQDVPVAVTKDAKGALLIAMNPGTAKDRGIPVTPQAPAHRQSLTQDQVVVTAERDIDRATLDHIVIPRFVQSHGVPSAKIDQVGRWRNDICPVVAGLEPRESEFVSRRIVAVAREVGAPTKTVGRCRANVEVLFTSEPQQQLQIVAKTTPTLLGYSASGQDLAAVSHPIQAWYATKSRSFVVSTSPINTVDNRMGRDSWGMQQYDAIGTTTTGQLPSPEGPVASDSDETAVRGVAGSRLTKGMTSEFVNVLVLVDSNRVKAYALGAIADYIAMLALTRATLDGCNPLASVVDLLSPDCAGRVPPTRLTEADSAYLKALYSSNLEMNLNLEQGEIHNRMLALLVGR